MSDLRSTVADVRIRLRSLADEQQHLILELAQVVMSRETRANSDPPRKKRKLDAESLPNRCVADALASNDSNASSEVESIHLSSTKLLKQQDRHMELADAFGDNGEFIEQLGNRTTDCLDILLELSAQNTIEEFQQMQQRLRDTHVGYNSALQKAKEQIQKVNDIIDYDERERLQGLVHLYSETMGPDPASWTP
ncbi:MAG: hypothetical protein SGILL_002129 [Bacillariaceae sp.]